MLSQLLTPETIQLLDSCQDWREAVAQSCQPLLRNHAIEPSYLEAIYRSHDAIGPFYVVGPGIAMPHARPEDGVNRLSLCLTLIREGVVFNSEGNDPVKLLIVLAATDSDSHIGIISSLAQLFDNNADVEAIMAASSQQEIMSIIAKY